MKTFYIFVDKTNSFKNQKNYIYWNNYNFKNFSILFNIDNDQKNTKKKIIKELDNFHNTHVNLFSELNLNICDGINFNLINSILDNNFYENRDLNLFIKFFYLKKILVKNKVRKIKIISKTDKLKKTFFNFAKINNLQITFSSDRQYQNLSRKEIKNFFNPSLVALPIFFIFLLKRITIFRIKKKNFFFKKPKILFINYLAQVNSKNKYFSSAYWGKIDELMENKKKKRFWLHLFLPESNFSATRYKNEFTKLNRNPLSNHECIDSYFNLSIFFKIIFIWFKIIIKKKKIDNMLKIKGRQDFLFFIFNQYFKENVYGYKFLINCYYFLLFENFFNSKKKFYKCFYLYENQSWERSMTYSFKKNNPRSSVYGVIHSSLRYWDMRYFNLNKLIRNSKIKKFFNQNIILSSKNFLKLCVANNFSKVNLFLAETLRYENLIKKKNNSSKLDTKTNLNNSIVFIGDYDVHINYKIIQLINFLSSKNKFLLVFKPHPIQKFKNNNSLHKSVVVTNDNIELLSKKHHNFVVSNTTTVGLELLIKKKNVITILDNELINFSPLKGLSYKNYLYELNKIYKKINKKNNFDKNFFIHNENYKKWSRLLN